MKRLLTIFLFVVLSFSLEGQSIIRANPFYNQGYIIDSANWEAEYKTVYYSIAEAGRPNIDTADYQNQMVKSLVDDGYWARMDLLYIFAQLSSAGALLNWIAPAGDDNCTMPGDDPVFTVYKGFQGNGTSTYLLTNWNGSTEGVNFTVNDATIGIYLQIDQDRNTDYAYAADDGTDYIRLYPSDASTVTGARLNCLVGVEQTAYFNSGSGMFVNTRRGANEIELYHNTETSDAEADASSAVPNGNVYLLAYGAGGGWSSNQISIFFTMDQISDAEYTALYNIFETYLRAINASVND